MKSIIEYLNEGKEPNLSDAVRKSIHDYAADPIKNFIKTMEFVVPDSLDTLDPTDTTPELVDAYKKEWTEFLNYIKKYKVK